MPINSRSSNQPAVTWNNQYPTLLPGRFLMKNNESSAFFGNEFYSELGHDLAFIFIPFLNGPSLLNEALK